MQYAPVTRASRLSSFSNFIPFVDGLGAYEQVPKPLVHHTIDLIGAALIVSNAMPHIAGMGNVHACADEFSTCHLPCRDVNADIPAVAAASARLSVTSPIDVAIPQPAAGGFGNVCPKAISQRNAEAVISTWFRAVDFAACFDSMHHCLKRIAARWALHYDSPASRRVTAGNATELGIASPDGRTFSRERRSTDLAHPLLRRDPSCATAGLGAKPAPVSAALERTCPNLEGVSAVLTNTGSRREGRRILPGHQDAPPGVVPRVVSSNAGASRVNYSTLGQGTAGTRAA